MQIYFDPLVSAYAAAQQRTIVAAQIANAVMASHTPDSAISALTSIWDLNGGNPVLNRRGHEWQYAIPRPTESHLGAFSTAPRDRTYTIVACDGSQAAPDARSSHPWAAVQVASVISHYGTGISIPNTRVIGPDDPDILDLLTSDVPVSVMATQIAAIRDRFELDELKRAAAQARNARAVPTIALLDGPLHAHQMEQPDAEYFATRINAILKTGAIPVGLVAHGRAKYASRLASLLMGEGALPDNLQPSHVDNLYDWEMYDVALANGQRSAFFEIASITNAQLQNAGCPSIGFFMIKMNGVVTRVETTTNLSGDQIGTVADVLMDSCQSLGYPYELALAHQLAVVRRATKTMWELRLNAQLQAAGIHSSMSPKETLKSL